MNEKHKGPHCNGLCEGAAYQIEINRLSSEGRIMRDALRRISALDKNYKWESEAIADDALFRTGR